VRVKDQLREYFAGTRRTFDVPLDPSGTAFDLSVWRYVAGIPFGEVRTYADLGARVHHAQRVSRRRRRERPQSAAAPHPVPPRPRRRRTTDGLRRRARAEGAVASQLEGHAFPDDENVTKGSRVAMR
jgi:alkylated DNA nucleotide flippase Atl1